tara:strand:- start:579 stop:1439 length:861 start_codon:yes stop_codon:yes gene_type:complete
MKILVTTYPFNEKIENHEVLFNTKKSKYNQKEIDNLLSEHQPDIVIAGTEKYDIKQLDLCKNLKMISRVGVGTSSINLQECSNRNIKVAITADAPTNSVAELAIANILYLLKKFHQQDMWYKVMGREIEECKIGIIGYGRIGRRVEDLLKSFNPKNIYINDPFFENSVSLEKIFLESDIITFHTPSLESEIDMKDFNKMKQNVCIVNTARADYINEDDLFLWLSRNKNASAAIDVYKNEPYERGKLLDLDNVLLTPHIGSFTSKARSKMEKESIYNINKFLEEEKL